MYLFNHCLLLAASLFSFADGFPEPRKGLKYLPRAPGVAPGVTGVPLTTVVPMPGAAPIPITRQSQVVNTYVPLYTLCPVSQQPAVQAQPVAPFANPTGQPAAAPFANPTGQQQPAVQAQAAAPFSNTTGAMMRIRRRQASPPLMGTQGAVAPIVSAAPVNQRPIYVNNTVVGPDGCLTEYSISQTTVCATTLQGLGTQVTVTDCSQAVTFSKDFNVNVAGNAVATLATDFIAPWQDLTDGATPTQVTERVCSGAPGGPSQCVDNIESWELRTVDALETTTNAVDFTATLDGPSKLTVGAFSTTIGESPTVFSTSTVVAHVMTMQTVSTITSTMGSGQAAASAELQTFETVSTSTRTITVFRATDLAAAAVAAAPNASAPANSQAADSTFIMTVHSTKTESVTVWDQASAATPI